MICAIEPSKISNKVFTIGSTTALDFVFDDWNVNYTYCNPFTYEACAENKLSIEDTPFIKFNPYNRNFTVFTDNYALTGTYTMIITGSLKYKVDKQKFLLTLANPCAATIVKPTIIGNV